MLSQKVADFLHHLKDGGVHRRFFWRDHEIYDNTQVDDDEDTTDADFEEAGRLTDSAVAEIHADDAEDNE